MYRTLDPIADITRLLGALRVYGLRSLGFRGSGTYDYVRFRAWEHVTLNYDRLLYLLVV